MESDPVSQLTPIPANENSEACSKYVDLFNCLLRQDSYL